MGGGFPGGDGAPNDGANAAGGNAPMNADGANAAGAWASVVVAFPQRSGGQGGMMAPPNGMGFGGMMPPNGMGFGHQECPAAGQHFGSYYCRYRLNHFDLVECVRFILQPQKAVSSFL